MYFLLINQFYAPDAAPTGQLLAQVAEALAADGHTVRVVCAAAEYAGAAVGHDPAAAAHDPGAVTVQRVRAAAFGHSPAARIVSYASFYAGVLREVLSGPKPDVVLTLTTPPLLSLAGTLARRLRGTRHLIWEMDVYPDVAVALSVLAKGSILERMIGALADVSRRLSDGIVVLGPCMRDLLAGRGIAVEKLHVAENWVDGAAVPAQPFPAPLPFTVLYSGNLGLAHDVETIAGAMEQLRDSSQFHFVFAGAGARRGALEERCRTHGIANVSFLPYQDKQRLAVHFARCHAGLVTQNPATCGAVVPSKTYAFLAAGRPFIFIGPEQATPNRIIERHQCGWRIEPGDVRALENLLLLLAARPGMVQAAGERALNAYRSCYHREEGASRICRILMATAADRQPDLETIPVLE